jgi:hypothetical protein
MADTTQAITPKTTEPRTTEAAASSPELAPVMKVTQAKATTSDVPKAAPKPRAAASAPLNEAGENGVAQRPANVSITQGGADNVEGDRVSIMQGGATNVTARSVEVRQGAIARADADDIKVTMGAVALARADRVNVEMGGMGIAIAREAHLTQGAARSVIAREVRVDQGLVGTTFAGKVTFERPSPVFLLVAGKTEGQVRAMFDWRGALAFGLLFGAIVGILRRR